MSSCLDIRDRAGLARFGLMSNQVWHDDPRRLLFVLSRYKFVAKMLRGRRRVLEVGCADAFGTRVVRQEVPAVVAVDFDPVLHRGRVSREDRNGLWNFGSTTCWPGRWKGKFSTRLSPWTCSNTLMSRDEDRFTATSRGRSSRTACSSSAPLVPVAGYASPPSKEGHVNCKDHAGSAASDGRHFENVFIFSMNDEVVHPVLPDGPLPDRALLLDDNVGRDAV